ncbi:MAG TPA: PKD domain-containing protein, partial [Bacteroidia bacterium]|nr:PKD domain-containing protein [Bacteroidia bacterium]
LVVTSDNGCKDSISKTVTVYPMPVVSFTAANVCNGTAVNFVNSSSVSSGSNSYLWNFGDGNTSNNTSPNYTYSASGTYSVKLIATTNNGCVDSLVKTVEVYPQPVAGFNASDVCKGTATSFTNTSTISSGTMSYVWTFGDGNSSTSSDPVYTYASAGTYTVKLVVTSDNGCKDSISKTVTVYPMPVVSFTAANVCEGNQVSFTNNSGVSSGTNSYSWNFGDGSTSANTSPTHTYTGSGTFDVKLIATTNNGCKDSLIKQVVVYPAPHAGFSATTVCSGDSTVFTNTSTISSGTMDYMWYLGDGNTSTATSFKYKYASAGTYTVKLVVSTSNGCKDSITQTVTVNPMPVASFTANDVCNGNAVSFSNNSTISSGSMSYLWKFGDGNTSNNVSPNYTYASSGTYSVELVITSDKGCVASVVKTVNVNPVPVAGFSANNVCDGQYVSFNNTSTISSGTMSYYWTFGDGNTSTSTSPSYLYASAGTYSVSLKATSDKGCVSTYNSSVTVYPMPTVSFTANNDCQGTAIEFKNTSSVSGGSNSYYWTFGDGNSSNNVSPYHTYSASGTYTVVLQATTDKGCIQTLSKQVTVYPLPVAGFSASNVCYGTSTSFTNSSTISSGTMSYLWNFGDNTTSTQTSPAHLYAAAGTYTVTLTVTSDKGCVSTISSQVTVYPMPVVSFTFNNICEGSSASFYNNSTITSGSMSFAWNFGDGATSTVMSPNHTYSVANSYNVKLVATSNYGCKDSSTKTITVYAMPKVSFSTANVCDKHSASFVNNSTISSGTMSHTWYFGDGSSSTVINPTKLYSAPGTYTVKLVTVSDKGCSDSVTKSVTVYDAPSVSFTTANVCYGNQASFTNTSSINTGVLTYKWYFGDGSTTTSMHATKMYASAGTYQVKLVATSNHGCSDSLTIPVTIYPKPDINIDAYNITCAGLNDGKITVHARKGTSPYSFSMNGTTYQNDSNFVKLGKGSYSVFAKDQRGCMDTGSFVITEPDPIVITVSKVNVKCKGDMTGSITLTATGGTGTYQYSADGGKTYQAGNVFNGLKAGYYIVSVKDGNNCSESQGVTITEPIAALDVTVASKTNVSCKGSSTGSVSLTGTGGTGLYQYSLNGTTFQASGYFNNLPAGNYKAYIRDANLCLDSVSFTITEPAQALTIKSIDKTDVACYGDFSGKLTVHASGGVKPYKFTLDKVHYRSDSNFINLVKGVYTVTVIDQNGCQTDQQVTISEPSAPLSIKVDNITNENCPNDGTGALTVSGAGGTAPYTYSKDGVNYQASGTFSNLKSGTYEIWVKDSKLCLQSKLITISSNTLPPEADFDVYINSHSASFVNKSKNATSYQWNFGDASTSTANSPVHIYKAAGKYTVTLIAINSCTSDTITKQLNIYPTSIGDENSGQYIGVVIYPNPADDYVNLEMTANQDIGELYIRVLNSEGAVMDEYKGDVFDKQYRHRIDLMNYAKGLYMVEITTKDGVLRHKIFRR